MQSIEEGKHPLSVELSIIEFWVQIYDLPIVFLTRKVAKVLGNFLSQIIEIHMSNRGEMCGGTFCEFGFPFQ